jgi:hypothetical protein
MSTTEELLGRKSSGSGLENQEYDHRDPSCWPHDTLYPQKLVLPSPTSGGCSVGIVCLRTKATELWGLGQTDQWICSICRNGEDKGATYWRWGHEDLEGWDSGHKIGNINIEINITTAGCRGEITKSGNMSDSIQSEMGVNNNKVKKEWK